jgi:hypothetical protein
LAWFLPCINSARNVDTDGDSLSPPAKHDAKAARFEKILEESELEEEKELPNEVLGEDGSHKNSSYNARSESTPWIVKEKTTDGPKQQDNGVVGLVGQVGSLHRQNESAAHPKDDAGKNGALVFEARSTPRWGHSPGKADEAPDAEPMHPPPASSNRPNRPSDHSQQVHPCNNIANPSAENETANASALHSTFIIAISPR